MSVRKPTEEKAIAWFAESKGLIPQLSTHPVYYFKNKETGEVTKHYLVHIVAAYKRFKEEQKEAKP